MNRFRPGKGWRAVCFFENYACFRTPQGAFCVCEIVVGDSPRWLGVFRKGEWSSISGATLKGMVYDRRGEKRIAAHTARAMLELVVKHPEPHAEEQVKELLGA